MEQFIGFALGKGLVISILAIGCLFSSIYALGNLVIITGRRRTLKRRGRRVKGRVISVHFSPLAVRSRKVVGEVVFSYGSGQGTQVVSEATAKSLLRLREIEVCMLPDKPYIAKIACALEDDPYLKNYWQVLITFTLLFGLFGWMELSAVLPS